MDDFTKRSTGHPDTIASEALKCLSPIPRSTAATTRGNELGIIDELVRLSVGLEDPRDIIEDLQRGLENMEKKESGVRVSG